ncbi:MAG: hypothetical protein WC789_10680 [Lentisphaeria bacterium]
MSARSLGNIYISLASLAGGTIKAQVKRGGQWADSAAGTISAAGEFTLRPCIAWRLVTVAGSPVFTGGWCAEPLG